MDKFFAIITKIDSIMKAIISFLLEALVIIMKVTKGFPEWLVFTVVLTFTPSFASSILRSVGITAYGFDYHDRLWAAFALACAMIHDVGELSREAKRFEFKGKNASDLRYLGENCPGIVKGILAVVLMLSVFLLGASEIPDGSRSVVIALANCLIVLCILVGLFVQIVRMAMQSNILTDASDTPAAKLELDKERIQNYFAEGVADSEIEAEILLLLEQRRDGEE